MRLAASVAILAILSSCGEASEVGDNAVNRDEIAFDGATTTNPIEQVDHGRRLSRILSCSGCHSESLEGQPFPLGWQQPSGIWASNLTLTIPTMDDTELEALIRRGVHPRRPDMWFMPSGNFQHLAATDMAALIAYLRSLEPSGDPTPLPNPTAFLSERMGQGNLLMTSVKVQMHRQTAPPDLGERLALGRYIVMATCSECHGPDLLGLDPFAPSLVVAGTYRRDELLELLTTGRARDGREIMIMGAAGEEQFSHLTDNEREQVADYVLAWVRNVTE